MIWEAHAPSIRWNINIINVAFVLSVITACSLALITKSCLFAVKRCLSKPHHKKKMRWNQDKPHKNEHQIVFQIYLFPPFLYSENISGWHIKSCSKANIPLSYLWAWNILNKSIFYEMVASWVCLNVDMMSSQARKVNMVFIFLAQMTPFQWQSKKMQKWKYIFPPSFHAVWMKKKTQLLIHKRSPCRL